MELELEADRQPVMQKPFGQLLRRKFPGYRGKMDDQFPVEVSLAKQGNGPLVIRPGTEDEFYFISRPEQGKIIRQQVFMHTAARAFDVHDSDHPGWNSLQTDTAVGFQQDPAVCRQQFIHQQINVFLEQGLATGYLYRESRVLFGKGDYLADIPARARLFVGVSGITETATQIAAGQSDKDAGLPGVTGLALNAEK
jgi:hypothetical protein